MTITDARFFAISRRPVTTRRRSNLQRLGVHQLHVQAIRGSDAAGHAYEEIAPPAGGVFSLPLLRTIGFAPSHPLSASSNATQLIYKRRSVVEIFV